jgi:hypothetical protein
MKRQLLDGSSMYQIGGQPGHRAEEHVFALKSNIAKYRSQGQLVIIQTSDIAKFFDKELIEDAILTSLKRGANPKACKLWYELNRGTKIRVRTGVGMTEFVEAGALVGQGTIGGALVSQAVLDEGISGVFAPGGQDELNYGSVPVSPLIFQDDVIHGAGGITEARLANDKIDIAVKSLNLRLNQEKTVCLVMGTNKQKRKVKLELEAQPLMCGEFETELKDQFKWLGQILSSGGLSDSVSCTVAAREGKIRGACIEITQIVNDWRAKIVGGFETALLLWELCCVPSLLHGAGTWTGISKATEKKLDQIQCWYLKLALQVGQGAASASLLWDTASLDMSLRVSRENILFVLYLRNLDEDTFASKVYKEQKVKKWPGLAAETLKICQLLHIEDCNETKQNISSYKQALFKALHHKNEEKLRLLGKGKCERILHEDYGKKEYLLSKNIFNVREHYRTRYGLLPFAVNYYNNKK